MFAGSRRVTFYIKLRPRIGQHRLEMDLKGPDRYLADEIKILIRASQESEVTDVMIMDCLHLFTVTVTSDHPVAVIKTPLVDSVQGEGEGGENHFSKLETFSELFCLHSIIGSMLNIFSKVSSDWPALLCRPMTGPNSSCTMPMLFTDTEQILSF